MLDKDKAFTPISDKEKQNIKPVDIGEKYKIISPVPDNISEPDAILNGKRPDIKYCYMDENGDVLGYICRFNKSGGKDILPLVYTKQGWKWQGFATPRPLYGLDLLATNPKAVIVITEGEKACEAARKLLPEHIVITSIGGSNAVSKTNWLPVKGRTIIIWGDADEAGTKYAESVQKKCLDIGVNKVGIVQLPVDVPKGWDVADAYADGWNNEQVVDLLQTAKYKYCTPKIPSNFRLRDDGVYFVPDSEDASYIHICSRLEVIAETRDSNGDNWGRLLKWQDRDNRIHEWAMPMSLLKGDCSDLRGFLLDQGLDISNKSKLAEYIQRVEPNRKCTSVEKIGWNDGKFVLPNTIIPKGCTDTFLQNEHIENHAFNKLGTLEQWQENLGMYIDGNSRLILSVCIAFASPLLSLCNEESGGFHLRGSSSVGKSTALQVAASIWGGGKGNGYINQWRSTANALEAIAASHNDCLLCIDEMGQIDGREAGEVAYMLANESGKKRMNKTTALRKSLSWKLLFLSTGEISLADKVQEAGKKTHAGMENRFVDIPADAGKNLGLFDNIHGFANAEKFARHLKNYSNKFYGTAIREYLNCLALEELDDLKRDINKTIDKYKDYYAPKDSCGQVQRVALRFAVLTFAGLYASKQGILPVDETSIVWGLETCFNAWLENRGTHEDLESKQVIDQILAFFETHHMSRFINRHDNNYDDRIINNCVGFREKNNLDKWDYFVYPRAFNNEICKGLDAKSASKILIKKGYLVSDKSGAACKTKFIPQAVRDSIESNEKRQRLYHFIDMVENYD